MALLNNFSKTVQVDDSVYQALLNQIGSKEGRTKSSDVNKALELSLVKLYYPEEVVRPAPGDMDYRQGVDAIAGGVKVQVKCNRDDKLYLEDWICRNDLFYKGCIDNCYADVLLKAWPMINNMIGLRIYNVETLKLALQGYRNFRQNVGDNPFCAGPVTLEQRIAMDTCGGAAKFLRNKGNKAAFFIV